MARIRVRPEGLRIQRCHPERRSRIATGLRDLLLLLAGTEPAKQIPHAGRSGWVRDDNVGRRAARGARMGVCGFALVC